MCPYWEPNSCFFPSSSVSVGTRIMFCMEGCTAVIDTGSSYITGPASSVSELMTTIGAQLDESGVSSKSSDAFSIRHTHSHTHWQSDNRWPFIVKFASVCFPVQSELCTGEDFTFCDFSSGWTRVRTQSRGLHLMGKR